MPQLPVITPAQESRHPGPPNTPLTEAERAGIARELARAVEGEVRFGPHDRMLYATDASLYQVEPVGVVIPASIEDAERAARFCIARGLPVLARGGGTSLAGQCTNRAVVIDFSVRCRALRDVDRGRRRCRVEPGITVEDLNDRLAGLGLFFAPDPATARQANVGGCIGNNAAGGRSIRYGRTSENVAGIEALVPGAGSAGAVARLERGAGGRDPVVRELTRRVVDVVDRHAELIRARFPKTLRRNAGYNLDLILRQLDGAGARADADARLDAVNLASLLCGSEGTLAVTLGADLILHPSPAARGLAVIGFASLDEAIGAVVPILETRPTAVELLDDMVLDLARANAEYRWYVDLMPHPATGRLGAVLYVEYSAETDAGELRASLAALEGIVGREAPSARVAVYTDAGAMQKAWKLRKAGEPLLHGMAGERKPITFIEDNAVPVERLAEFVRRLRAIIEGHGTRAAYWAHASVGVLHVRPLLNIRDEADRERIRAIALEAADLARSLGGVMSGEHGDGRVRSPLLERFYGPELMGAFRHIKRIFDPANLLNPGNIVEPGPVESITERLRVEPEPGRPVGVPGVETYFEYADQHGFAGAVEMCNGAGVCRKKAGGTMCPSYMATLDERHSTRGRGNALRLAITGQFGGGGGRAAPSASAGRSVWDDPDTIATLDLCLSCKACKAECPSNVDIARLKAEYTAQRYRAIGRAPLGARLFGHIRRINRLGAMAPGFANRMNRLGPVRAVVDRALGLAPQRTLPEFRKSLARRWERARSGSITPEGVVVALFADCFTMYNEPELGLAARRVLEACGYEVRLVDAGCCGRAMISTGVLDDARRTIDATLARLVPLARDPAVRAIVVCEPSCLSAIKDDWLQLRLGAARAERQSVAAKAWLVEEFVEARWDEHPRRPRVEGGAGGPVLLHGHCHQKALWGVESSAGLLRRVVGAGLRVLDSGCCGMAGAFGYAASHYDLSMRIGELSLFPSVRAGAADGRVVVAAPGTSCRHQIRDGTGVAAVHPVEVLARALGGSGTGCGGAGPEHGTPMPPGISPQGEGSPASRRTPPS